MRTSDRSKDYHKAEQKSSFSGYFGLKRNHGFGCFGRLKMLELLFFVFALLISSSTQSEHGANTCVVLPPKPMHSLPFPAITICPEVKADKAVIDFTQAYIAVLLGRTEDYPDETLSQIEALSQVCDPHLFENSPIKSPPTSGSEFADILRRLTPTKFLLFCRFQGNFLPCDSFFEETLTGEGFCYTFNMRQPVDAVTDETGNSKLPYWSRNYEGESAPIDVHPHRAFSGTNVGLNVVLQTNSSDLDHICTGPVQGYRLKVHSPDEFPVMTSGYQRIPLGKELLVNVKPAVSIKTDDCHSTLTHPLKFFNAYTQSNCLAECTSSYVQSQCGCVKFSMAYDNETEICGQQKTECIAEALKEFATVHKFESTFPCSCKPSCEELTFSTQTSTTEYEYQKTFAAYTADLEGEFPRSIMSRLVVYIGDEYFQPTLTVPLVEVSDKTLKTSEDVERPQKVGTVL